MKLIKIETPRKYGVDPYTFQVLDPKNPLHSVWELPTPKSILNIKTYLRILTILEDVSILTTKLEMTEPSRGLGELGGL